MGYHLRLPGRQSDGVDLSCFQKQLGAILLERIGGTGMYAVFGVLMLAALIVYLLLERKLPKVEYVEV